MAIHTGSIASTSNLNQQSNQVNQQSSSVSHPKNLQDSLESNIEAIGQLRAGEQGKEFYITKCVNSIVQAVPNCGFPDEELKKDYANFENHLSLFNSIVDNNCSLSEEDKQSIKTDVKRACQHGIAEKWMENGAHYFHSLFLLSTLEDRSRAAQEWTQHFFLGAELHFDLMNHTKRVPESVIEKAKHTYEKWYQSWMEKQGQTIQRLSEQHTNSFHARLLAITNRAQEDFYSLLAEEKELLEWAINVVVPQDYPLFTMKLSMMKACFDIGHSLHENCFSIVESEEAERVFLEIFTILQEGIADYFSQWKPINDNS